MDVSPYFLPSSSLDERQKERGYEENDESVGPKAHHSSFDDDQLM